MAETSIEWTATYLPDGTVLPGYTFNPWIGCQKVGPSCDHCYAEISTPVRVMRAEGAEPWGPGAPRRLTSDANWRKPLAWNAQAAKSGIRRKVFCASLADVFDNAVDPAWRARLWRLIWDTPHLDWLLLTKRPGNITGMLPAVHHQYRAWGTGWPNVWLGCTVVNQAEADRDIPKLLATPAAIRFVSAEPLLGPVDASFYLHSLTSKRAGTIGPGRLFRDKIDWLIVGGESGPHARPMHPDWARSLRDQCAAAAVPFFFKPWGEWVSAMQIPGTTGISSAPPKPGYFAHPHRRRVHGGALDGQCYEGFPDHHDIIRVGKRTAGRKLDGREHNAMPGAAQ